MKPLLSVVIPTWNRSTALARAIKSVQSQTYQHIEVLVCDDGSTDDTKEIVKEICNKDSRVKWVPGKHSGLPAVPRNRGIRKARGEWLAFLDDDDIWIRNKIEKQIDFCNKYGARAACSNAIKVSKSNKSSYFKQGSINTKSEFNNLLKENYIICSSAIINRGLIEIVGNFPEDVKLKAVEDYAFWLMVSSQTPIYFQDEELLYYTDDKENSIRNNNQTVIDQKRSIISSQLTWFVKNCSLKQKVQIIITYIKTWV